MLFIKVPGNPRDLVESGREWAGKVCYGTLPALITREDCIVDRKIIPLNVENRQVPNFTSISIGNYAEYPSYKRL